MTTGSPYLDYFGFREDPFSLTPNPEYFFLTKEHELAFEELQRGVSERKGIIMMIGEMGTGKTILLRTLKNKLPDNVLVSYQLNPSLGFTLIVKKMLKDFGLQCDTDSRAELISVCHEKLSELGNTGQYGLLILDEAQALNEEVLEDIRILSNIEDERGKFLNVILAGQPELADIISMSSLRSLKHRIGVRIYLKPMDSEEIFLYLNHRLEVADWTPGEQLFTKNAMTWITYSSNGNPRLINVIADNALHRAYRERIRVVDKEMLKKTLAALEGREPLGKGKPRRFSLSGMNPILAAILVFVIVLAVLLPSRISKWMDRKAARRAAVTTVQDTTAQIATAQVTTTEDATAEDADAEVPAVQDTALEGSVSTASTEALDIPGLDPPVSDVVESDQPEPVPESTVSDKTTEDTVVILEDEDPVEAETSAEGQAGLTDVDETTVGRLEAAGDSVAIEPPPVETEVQAKDPKAEEGWTVRVKRGEWLYLIVEREYGYASWDMVNTVVELNERVTNPNRVYPGQKLYLPPRSYFE